MAFIELFKRAAKHVRAQGVEVTLVGGKPLAAAAIAKLSAKSAIPIPDEVCEFYREVGDGFVFDWSTDDEGEGPFSSVLWPRFKDLIIPSLELLKWRFEWGDSPNFKYTKDPKLASVTATRMREWLGFHDEGNGDRFCFDTAKAPSPVVFDQHDWFDAGTGDNGHVMGASLFDFYRQWSKVCFQFPKDLWWPGVFNRRRGVNWRSKEFREPFRLRVGK